MVWLLDRLSKLRESETGGRRDGGGDAAADQVDPQVVQRQQIAGEPHQAIDHDRGEGADRDEAAEGFRRARLVDPLQRERGLQRLVVVIAERHEDGGQIGRASCRESVCLYVYISLVAVTLKKKKKNPVKNYHDKKRN